ncbi:MAG: ABC transporter permease [Spirochaetota bacterium]
MKVRPRITTVALGVAVVIVLCILFILPFGRLAIIAGTRGGIPTMENLRMLAPSGADFRALRNSMLVGVLSTTLAVGGAAIASWLLERTDVPGARFWSWALILPYFIPPFVTAFAWTRLLGPIGYYNLILMNTFGLDRAPISIYGAGGVVAISAIYGFPFAFLILRRAIRNSDGSLEEAARISGSSPLRSAVTVTLPTLLPSIGAAAIIVFVTTVSMFGIPAILGVPGRFVVLTTRIYAYVGSFGNRYGLNIAAALSLVLLLIGTLGLLAQQWVIRRERFVTITGKSLQAAPVQLGALRWVVAAFFGVVIALGVFAPIAALLATGITRSLGVPLLAGNVTLAHFATVFTGMPVVARSTRNSLLLGLGIATITTIVATGVVFLRRYGRSGIERRLARTADILLSVPYAVPGMVIGIAMIVTWIRPVLGIRVYNTWWILAMAYLVRFMIFPLRSADAATRALDPSLIEAAQLSGSTPARITVDIVTPLIRPSLISGWILVFMPALTELTLSILLYSPGNETIGVTAYNIIQEGLLPVASALAVLITLGVLLIDLILRRLGDHE